MALSSHDVSWPGASNFEPGTANRQRRAVAQAGGNSQPGARGMTMPGAAVIELLTLGHVQRLVWWHPMNDSSGSEMMIFLLFLLMMIFYDRRDGA